MSKVIENMQGGSGRQDDVAKATRKAKSEIPSKYQLPDTSGLTYEVKADVGGKLAQLGGRLIDSTAKKIADDFFETFAALLGGAPVDAPAAPAKQGWLQRWFGRRRGAEARP